MSAPAVIEKQASVPATKKSVLVDMADRFGMEPAAFEATLRNTVVPGDCSREQFAAFLLVAKEYGLNPLTKEIYAFPAKGGGIQPIVGIDGWANLVNSHPSFDGMTFVDVADGAGSLVSITCQMYRKDRTHTISATEYMAECKRPTEPWQKWPRRMLRHKAMIQAARYAFGFAGIVDPDEGERWKAESARDVTPRRAQRLTSVEAFDKYAGVERVDASTGEVTVEGFVDDDQSQASKTEVTAPAASRQGEASGNKEAGAKSVHNDAAPASTSKDQPIAAQSGASKEADAAGAAPGASVSNPSSSDFDEDQVDGADRPWPPGAVPTNEAEYERYLDTRLASMTKPSDWHLFLDWWKTDEQAALRQACKVTRIKELQNKAVAYKAKHLEKLVP